MQKVYTKNILCFLLLFFCIRELYIFKDIIGFLFLLTLFLSVAYFSNKS